MAGDFFEIGVMARDYAWVDYSWRLYPGQGLANTLLSASWLYHLWYIFYSSLGLAPETLRVLYLYSFFIISGVNIIILSRYLELGDTILETSAAALLYCFNPLTLGIFASPWGYTHHFLLYPFIPLLLLTIFIILCDSVSISVISSALVLFSILFFTINNLAFIVPLIAIVLCIAAREVTSLRSFFSVWLRLFAILVTCTIGLAHQLVVVPFTIILTGGLKSTVVFGGAIEQFVRNYSSNISDSVIMVMDAERWPPNYIQESILLNNFVLLIIVVFSFLSVLAFIPTIVFNKNTRKVRTVQLIWVLFLLLSIRIAYPMNIINAQLFEWSGYSLRSSEKLFAWIPCLMTITLMNGLTRLSTFLKRRTWLISLTVLTVSVPLLFVLPVARSNLDRERGGHRYWVTVPNELKNLDGILNNLESDNQYILSIPYTVTNSVSWQAHPSWNFLGTNPLGALTLHPVIGLNTPDNPGLEGQFTGLAFNSNINVMTIHNIINRFAAKYIIIFRDVPAQYLDASTASFNAAKLLVEYNYLENISSNLYYDLYSVTPEWQVPFVTWVTSNSVAGTALSYSRTSTIDIEIAVPASSGIIKIYNSYNDGWRLISCHESTSLTATVSPYSLEVLGEPLMRYLPRPLEWLRCQSPDAATRHAVSDGWANEWEVSEQISDGAEYRAWRIVYWPELYVQVSKLAAAVFAGILLLSLLYLWLQKLIKTCLDHEMCVSTDSLVTLGTISEPRRPLRHEFVAPLVYLAGYTFVLVAIIIGLPSNVRTAGHLTNVAQVFFTVGNVVIILSCFELVFQVHRLFMFIFFEKWKRNV